MDVSSRAETLIETVLFAAPGPSTPAWKIAVRRRRRRVGELLLVLKSGNFGVFFGCTQADALSIAVAFIRRPIPVLPCSPVILRCVKLTKAQERRGFMPTGIVAALPLHSPITSGPNALKTERF
jgi:hypothetical protein